MEFYRNLQVEIENNFYGNGLKFIISFDRYGNRFYFPMLVDIK